MYSGDKTSSCPGAWEDKRRWNRTKAWKSGTAILSKGSFFDYGCLFRHFDLVGRELWLHLWTHPLHVDGVSRAPPHTGSEKSVSPANWLLGGWIHFASLAGTAFLQSLAEMIIFSSRGHWSWESQLTSRDTLCSQWGASPTLHVPAPLTHPGEVGGLLGPYRLQG